jgi:hypothetical protein
MMGQAKPLSIVLPTTFLGCSYPLSLVRLIMGHFIMGMLLIL